MSSAGPLRAAVPWVIAFAIVVAILGYETGWGDRVRLPVPVPAAPKAKPVDVALLPEYRIAGGLEARRETVERALFNPTRRPAPAATQAPGGGTAKLDRGQYVLTGTTIDAGASAAVLKEVKTGKSHVVRQGEKIGDLTVAEVAPDKVRLKLGSQVEELDLKIAAGPKTTIQPGAAHRPVPGQPRGASEAARLEALRALERAERAGEAPGQPARRGEARRRQPPSAAPGAAPTQGTASTSEVLAERRRAAIQAVQDSAPIPRTSPGATDPGFLDQYRRALQGQRP